jgi:hypothetical protein
MTWVQQVNGLLARKPTVVKEKPKAVQPKVVEKKELTGINALILKLLSDGKWRSPTEIRNELDLPKTSAAFFASRLTALIKKDKLKRRRSSCQTWEYTTFE